MESCDMEWIGACFDAFVALAIDRNARTKARSRTIAVSIRITSAEAI